MLNQGSGLSKQQADDMKDELKNKDKLADKISSSGYELIKEKHTTSQRIKEFTDIMNI